MADAVTVVVGADRGIGRALVGALAERARRVVPIGADEVDLTDPDAVRVALDAAAASAPEGVSVLVLAHLDPTSFSVVPLVELSEDAWEVAAERSLRAAFVVLQQAHAALADGARVVLVLPTVAASGAAGLVPLCSAVEGIRVMAKAVARRWGARGITVNTVEVDLAAFVLGDDPGGADDGEGGEDDRPTVPVVAQLGVTALPPGSAVGDVAGLIEMLDSPAGAALTGALLVADRGTVMLP
jgi:NAD(P)-dependent dehydrogenase (short-subunit alcohol dehydrogenase family)